MLKPKQSWENQDASDPGYETGDSKAGFSTHDFQRPLPSFDSEYDRYSLNTNAMPPARPPPPASGPLQDLCLSAAVSPPFPLSSSNRSGRPESSSPPPRCTLVCGKNIVRMVFPESFSLGLHRTPLSWGETAHLQAFKFFS